jgi:hypothetical protein
MKKHQSIVRCITKIHACPSRGDVPLKQLAALIAVERRRCRHASGRLLLRRMPQAIVAIVERL